MDSITQAALGAAVGEALLGKKIGYKGAILGAVVGTIPDLDMFLTPFYDGLQKISVHRGYSHSIIFCVLGAFLIAFILSKIKWSRDMTYRRRWLFSFLALFTHVILDAFTAFGTQLLLPFTDWRVSFDSISIIDPVYTIPLIIGVVLSSVLHKKEERLRGFPNTLGLIVSSLYLIFTLANKQHIERAISNQLREQNLPMFELLTVPVSPANLQWYGVAKDKTHLHIGKYSALKANEIQFHSFPINDHLLDGLDDYLVDRMKWFAQGFYTVAEKDGTIRIYNMQCDMQGVREYGNYKAPTAFHFEINPNDDGTYKLNSGMHMEKTSD